MTFEEAQADYEAAATAFMETAKRRPHVPFGEFTAALQRMNEAFEVLETAHLWRHRREMALLDRPREGFLRRLMRRWWA